MHARFYAPDLAPGDRIVRLPSEEAGHLTRVMRLRTGASVRVFNGRGLECEGRVEEADRGRVTVAVGDPVPAARESRVSITLAQAVLKGDSMDTVVRDAVMLGVNAIVPVLSARVEGDRRGHAAASRVARWQRIAISSSKQCGRAVVPAVAEPMTLAACLVAATGAVRLALVEPAAVVPAAPVASAATDAAPASALLCIGPEGGWAEEDTGLFITHGVRCVTLGGRTLRADAAAMVGLSALLTMWGEWS